MRQTYSSEPNTKIKIDQSLDVKDLACPMPLLKTRLALHSLKKGQKLEIISSDRSMLDDLNAFCRQKGYLLLTSFMRNGAYIHVLEK